VGSGPAVGSHPAVGSGLFFFLDPLTPCPFGKRKDLTPCPSDPLPLNPNYDVPAGIFSPAVDDGYYVKLKQLRIGAHTLHLRAETATDVAQDVTYSLTVVPVSRR
jgi:hypothetical protein